MSDVATRNNPARRWCFTINNPTAEETERLHRESTWEGARSVVLQLERGGSGTPHYQGYVVWKTAKRLTGCVRFQRGHWEVARGSDQQCREYCSKEDTRTGDVISFGVPASACGSGARTDLIKAKAMIDAGATEQEVADDCWVAWCSNYRAFSKYRTLKGRERKWIPRIYILIGPSGSGKSTWVENRFPGAYWVPNPNGSSVFFDGYDGHKTIVLDDFYGWLPYSFLLRLLDSHKLIVNTKGGATDVLAKNYVITSNNDWENWYSRQFQIHQCASLKRRLDEWATFIDPQVKVEERVDVIDLTEE